MSREEQYKSYYDNILTGHSYVDTRLSLQTAISDFLAQTFFGKDFSRVIYTNPEFAFRKRVERLANGIQDENLFLSTLSLPFCSFCLQGNPEIIKTATASIWSGYYDTSIERQMHFINTKQKVSVQFFFDRSDDLTVAYEIAQVEALGEYPIRYIQDVFWRNQSIPFPIWITVKNVKAGNDMFNETAWLEQNHLFAMTMELEIELARIQIHRGLNAVQLPFKWHATGNIDTWEDGETIYYTQKCVLLWSERALGFSFQRPKEPTQEAKDLENALLKNPQLTPADKLTLDQIQTVMPNKATAEIVEGYYRDATKIIFNRLLYNEEKTTIDEKGEVTAWIDTLVKPATYQYWDYTEIYIPSRHGGSSIVMKNCKDKYVQIDGLHPNSIYTIYFIAHDIEGNYNTIPLEFTTPVWTNEKLPAVSSENADPQELVSTVEAAKNSEAPKKIVAKGLIGLEL